jgi:hypothetical protein
MNTILLILIASAMVYALAFRLGVRRGRNESRMYEFRRGHRKGYEQARNDLSELFRLKDEDLLLRIRELRRSEGK